MNAEACSLHPDIPLRGIVWACKNENTGLYSRYLKCSPDRNRTCI